MKQFCNVLVLASLAILAQAMPSSVQTQLQGALDKYLVQANNLDMVSADVTSQCFALYLPMLNEVAASFSSSYQACITTYNNELANLTAQAQKDQVVYQQDVAGLCSAFTSCNNSTRNDSTAFFSCYANAAQADVSIIYDIATNAASTANTLAESIKANQDLEYQCTNTTESNYVRDTAATYDLLDSCLKNGLPTTSTAAPAPTTTQSPATTGDDNATGSTAGSSTTTVTV
ncbi:uncharacterized protein LOC6579135 [Drosophila mojavensis]|uniref:Protein TsetseEP domain-containing protein n=1 Tax=Drosophila mojavensis TaxID=7230 RepID=B4KNK8_DROMO|nr:uncharacterized protein LOC6579135 [Drosophila mojavensis]EDW08967.1 uncharacterized protein Dmoj_GI19281 [Drosophila mojavensis]